MIKERKVIKGKSVAKGTVGNKKGKKDISQEPEMLKLARIYDGMTEEEQARTMDYLKRIGPE